MSDSPMFGLIQGLMAALHTQMQQQQQHEQQMAAFRESLQLIASTRQLPEPGIHEAGTKAMLDDGQVGKSANRILKRIYAEDPLNMGSKDEMAIEVLKEMRKDLSIPVEQEAIVIQKTKAVGVSALRSFHL
jgi:hypothetical protein